MERHDRRPTVRTAVATRRRSEAETRIIALSGLVAVGLTQLGDLATFARMVAVSGIHAEANPLVAAVHSSAGILPLVGVKLALIVFVVATVMIVSRRFPAIAFGVLAVATLAGIVGTASNILSTAV